MKLTIGQKAVRVLEFLLGLRRRRVAAALLKHGFTDAELDEGWRRLQALTANRLDGVTLPVSSDPVLLQQLDAWENLWFPISEAALSTNFPEVYEKVFKNLSQTDGIEVVVSVRTFVGRIEALAASGPDAEARALLERRGLTRGVIDEAKVLLQKLGQVDTTVDDAPVVTPEQEAELERRLWSWYLEWSGIARAAIKDRPSLRALGFLRDGGTTDEETEVVASGPTTNVQPGMPGADPFAGAPR